MKKTLSVSFIIALILLLAAGGYLLYDTISWKPRSPLEAIAPDAALILKVNNSPSTLQKIEESSIWQGLKKLPWNLSRKATGKLLSLAMNDRTLSGLLKEAPLYLSVHSDSSVLISIGIPERKIVSEIRSMLISDSCSLFFSAWNGTTGSATGDSVLYFHFEKGVMLLSNRTSRLKSARERLESGESLASDEGLQKLISVSGRKVDANLYVHYPVFSSLVSLPSFGGIIENGSALGYWSSLDVIVKQNEVLLTGYTISQREHSLAFLSEQEPVEMKADRVLPYMTSRFCWAGFSDFRAFIARNGKKGDGRDISSLENYVAPWIGNEMVVATVADPRIRDGNGNFLVTAIYPAKDPMSALRDLSSGKESHKDFQIHRLKSNPFSSLCDISPAYWSIIDKYIIWSEKKEDLKIFIDTYISGKTLDVNENYIHFSDNIADDGNLLYYVNIRNSLDWIAGFLGAETGRAIRDHKSEFSKFHGFSLQYSRMGEMALTNSVITYNESYREEDLASWKVQLDSPLAGKPYLVYDHRSRKNKIVAFDKRNIMYLIDDYGNIIWKLQLAEMPVSEVYEVDYYKNGKIQYLFNTENYIYLVDLMGRKVENFPIRLNKGATSGLALFDYDNDRDYRVLVPSIDNKIYNYDLKGNKIRGWKEPKMADRVDVTPQHLVAGRKDYLIFSDSEGNVKITDRRGSDRIRIRNAFKKSPNSLFYINKTNSKGIIITTDQSGNLVYLGTDGNTQSTVFDSFSENHYFLYSDFDRNGHNDFIFLDKNKLIVYDRFKKEIFNFTFDSEINSPPEIFRIGRGERILGVVSKQSRQVFLFNAKGDVLISSGLIGETPFTVGSLGDNKELNLIVGAGNILYNYPLN